MSTENGTIKEQRDVKVSLQNQKVVENTNRYVS